MVRSLLLGAALTLSAGVADAQITTFIAPPRADIESLSVIAERDSLRRDSLAQVAVSDMRAWVDSAAGVAVPDSLGLADTLSRPITTFEDGSFAPATASNLPMLALMGLASFLGGLVLLAQRSRGGGG